MGDKNVSSNSRRMSESLYIIDWSKSIGRRKPAVEIEEETSSSESSLDEREETRSDEDRYSPSLLYTIASDSANG